MKIKYAQELDHSASHFHTGCESVVNHGKTTTAQWAETTHSFKHLRCIALAT